MLVPPRTRAWGERKWRPRPGGCALLCRRRAATQLTPRGDAAGRFLGLTCAAVRDLATGTAPPSPSQISSFFSCSAFLFLWFMKLRKCRTPAYKPAKAERVIRVRMARRLVRKLRAVLTTRLVTLSQRLPKNAPSPARRRRPRSARMAVRVRQGRRVHCFPGRLAARRAHPHVAPAARHPAHRPAAPRW